MLDHPTAMSKGGDPQLEKAIEEVLRLLESNPPVQPSVPAYEDRTLGTKNLKLKIKNSEGAATWKKGCSSANMPASIFILDRPRERASGLNR